MRVQSLLVLLGVVSYVAGLYAVFAADPATIIGAGLATIGTISVALAYPALGYTLRILLGGPLPSQREHIYLSSLGLYTASFSMFLMYLDVPEWKTFLLVATLFLSTIPAAKR